MFNNDKCLISFIYMHFYIYMHIFAHMFVNEKHILFVKALEIKKKNTLLHFYFLFLNKMMLV